MSTDDDCDVDDDYCYYNDNKKNSAHRRRLK